MATVHITFRNATHLGGASIPSKGPRMAETITSSASSQATTITALTNEIATVTSSGGAVFMAIAGTPTAVSGAGDLITDGATREFGPLAIGDKVAIINV